jgi:hypothetical protein
VTVRAGLKACTTSVGLVLIALVLVAQAFRPALVVQAFRPAFAQQQPASTLASFIKVQAPVIALVHARLIDGSGAAAREDQTIVIRDGNIAAIGDAARTTPPAGATLVDLTGKSVIPGLVMLH